MKLNIKIYGSIVLVQTAIISMVYFAFIQTGMANYFITLLSVLIATCLLIYFLMKNILKPIRNIKNILTEFDSGNGKLSQRYEEERNDELGDLINGFNSFLDHIEEIIIKANLASEEVAKNSKDLTNIITTIIKGNGSSRDNISDLKDTTTTVLIDVENQTASTEEISASITEISKNLNSLSKKTEDTMKLSNETSNFAKIGRESLEESL